MSFNTWTREELLSSCLPLETTAWRVVEAQHRVSTMKLVDNLREQKALEEILEDTKPPKPDIPEGMNFLLYSPFRYSVSNPFSSRFRRANALDGVFYASASPDVAIAEMAFYRMLFFEESPNTPRPTNPQEHTAFAVQLCTDNGLDLTRAPINKYDALWTAKDDYAPCHILANEARRLGVQVISYYSMRDLQHRLNYAVLTPAAFAQLNPFLMQSWHLDVRPEMVVAKCENPKMGLTFLRTDFDIAARIKASSQAA